MSSIFCIVMHLGYRRTRAWSKVFDLTAKIDYIAANGLYIIQELD